MELTSGMTVDKEKGVGNAAVTRLMAENNIAMEDIPKRTGTRYGRSVPVAPRDGGHVSRDQRGSVIQRVECHSWLI